MSEKDVYIGETSIQIGEHGFINQPKEIIEYIKYLQNQLQLKENIIKELDKQNKELGTELSLAIDKYEKKLFIKENIIKEVREYIESIEKVDCRYFDYNRALKEMLISYEDLKKKVEEDGTLEGHFIEIDKLKLLEILDNVGDEK